MKKLLAVAISIALLMSVSNSGVFATVNTKMALSTITKAYTYTDDLNTPKFIIFEGKLTNKTKYAATINKLTIKADINSPTTGILKKTFVFIAGKASTQTNFKILFPTTIKANGFVFYKLISPDSTDLKYVTNASNPINPAEYSKTTHTLDVTITATTTKTTKIYNMASTSGKVLKTLKSKTKVFVVGVPTKTFIKVKYGTTSGYVLIANIK